MSYVYELEGIYAQLQAMELDDETFNDIRKKLDESAGWSEIGGKLEF